MSSLIGRIRIHLGSAEGRLVNRLDRETSGVVLVAKSAVAARELGRLVAAPGDAGKAGCRGALKKYWAVVHGHVLDDSQSIDAPLGRDENSTVAIKDAVRADGAAASTSICVLRRLTVDGRPFTTLDVTPATGRKHQIRIHLAHIGHAIVGDKIYGGDETIYLRFVTRTLTDADREALTVENHLLHARSFSMHWRGRDWRFEAAAGANWAGWLN